jgi:ankyrin repeat protein
MSDVPQVEDAQVQGATPSLRDAAWYGDIEMVRTLLAKGNVSPEASSRALEAAARKNHNEIAVALLCCESCKPSSYALQRAARNGNADLVQLMLENGAQSNHLALHSAVESGNVEIVKMLLKSGACQTPSSFSLSVAVREGYIEIVKLLLESGARCARSLESASYRGHTEIVKMLLESGARQTPETSPDALQLAAYHGHIEVVKMLLESGARETTETSSYALQGAARGGHIEIVKMLLDSGSRQMCPDSRPKSKPWTSPDALKLAAVNGNIEIVRMLLKSGARETPVCSKGALHWTALYGHTAIVKMLRAVENLDRIKERLEDESQEMDAGSYHEINASIDKLLTEEDNPLDSEDWWDKQRKALIDLFERRCGALIKQMDIDSFAEEFLDS